MAIRLKVNVRAGARKYLLAQYGHQIEPILTGLGQVNVKWLIENSKDLQQFLPAQTQADMKHNLAGWKWVTDIFTDDEVIAELPPWFKSELDTHGEKGLEWAKRQLLWLRSLFS